MAVTWWVVADASSGQYSVVSTETGTAEDAAFQAGQESGGLVVVDNSGFPTRAAALAAVPGIAKFEGTAPGLWSSLVGAATGGAAQAAAAGVQTAVPATGATVSNPFTDVAHALTAFYDTVTDGKLWRSLGWLLLGVALMLTGIGLLIGPAAARRSPAGVAAGFARQAYG